MQYFEITPQGAKNEALQILSAVLLSDGKVTISNLPDILDVNRLIDLLKFLGVKVKKNAPGEYAFQSDDVKLEKMKTPEFRQLSGRLRGSVMSMGPLLARVGGA